MTVFSLFTDLEQLNLLSFKFFSHNFKIHYSLLWRTKPICSDDIATAVTQSSTSLNALNPTFLYLTEIVTYSKTTFCATKPT